MTGKPSDRMTAITYGLLGGAVVAVIARLIEWTTT